jgi:quercetin dioxygenase-like cupin family protein
MINTCGEGNAMVHIGCVANIYSRMMHFIKAGNKEQGHAHLFDHLTLLAKGKLLVTVDGVATEFTAPNMIYIRAGKVHELEALVNETVAYCIHALRDHEGNILDPSMIPDGVEAIDIAAPVNEGVTYPWCIKVTNDTL